MRPMRSKSCRIFPAATLLRTAAVILLLVVVLHPTLVSAQVVSYEATSLPEDDGWQIFQLYCDPTVWTEDGWLFHDVQMCEGVEPPEGQVAAYRRSLADFNSDEQVDAEDMYYFQECLTTAAGGWAGCAWADMDFSGGVDCADWELFLDAWTDPAGLDGDGNIYAFDLAILLGSWG